jgi:hypothetical protein
MQQLARSQQIVWCVTKPSSGTKEQTSPIVGRSCKDFFYSGIVVITNHDGILVER